MANPFDDVLNFLKAVGGGFKTAGGRVADSALRLPNENLARRMYGPDFENIMAFQQAVRENQLANQPLQRDLLEAQVENLRGPERELSRRVAAARLEDPDFMTPGERKRFDLSEQSYKRRDQAAAAEAQSEAAASEAEMRNLETVRHAIAQGQNPYMMDEYWQLPSALQNQLEDFANSRHPKTGKPEPSDWERFVQLAEKETLSGLDVGRGGRFRGSIDPNAILFNAAQLAIASGRPDVVPQEIREQLAAAPQAPAGPSPLDAPADERGFFQGLLDRLGLGGEGAEPEQNFEMTPQGQAMQSEGFRLKWESGDPELMKELAPDLANTPYNPAKPGPYEDALQAWLRFQQAGGTAAQFKAISPELYQMALTHAQSSRGVQ